MTERENDGNQNSCRQFQYKWKMSPTTDQRVLGIEEKEEEEKFDSFPDLEGQRWIIETLVDNQKPTPIDDLGTRQWLYSRGLSSQSPIVEVVFDKVTGKSFPKFPRRDKGKPNNREVQNQCFQAQTEPYHEPDEMLKLLFAKNPMAAKRQYDEYVAKSIEKREAHAPEGWASYDV